MSDGIPKSVNDLVDTFEQEYIRVLQEEKDKGTIADFTVTRDGLDVVVSIVHHPEVDIESVS